jgi:hypothetical protein
MHELLPIVNAEGAASRSGLLLLLKCYLVAVSFCSAAFLCTVHIPVYVAQIILTL